MDTITVSKNAWQWAQEAALLLAALRICGIKKMPIWYEAQRMYSESPPQSQITGTAIVRRSVAYEQ